MSHHKQKYKVPPSPPLPFNSHFPAEPSYPGPLSFFPVLIQKRTEVAQVSRDSCLFCCPSITALIQTRENHPPIILILSSFTMTSCTTTCVTHPLSSSCLHLPIPLALLPVSAPPTVLILSSFTMTSCTATCVTHPLSSSCLHLP